MNGMIQSEGRSGQYISSDVHFYTINDVMGLTSWSRKVVLKLFNDPEFPATDLGKAKLIEAHALISYFSVRRDREIGCCKEDKNGELKNELRRRLQKETE